MLPSLKKNLVSLITCHLIFSKSLHDVNTDRYVVSPVPGASAGEGGVGHGQVALVTQHHHTLTYIVDKLNRSDDTMVRGARISTRQHT